MPNAKQLIENITAATFDLLTESIADAVGISETAAADLVIFASVDELETLRSLVRQPNKLVHLVTPIRVRLEQLRSRARDAATPDGTAAESDDEGSTDAEADDAEADDAEADDAEANAAESDDTAAPPDPEAVDDTPA